ncbi:MAG: DUF5666 domain-containing protein [Acidobacteriota bacterium]|nr:DUF5666 domain-containing protein [Acidobacteriota bacterium]
MFSLFVVCVVAVGCGAGGVSPLAPAINDNSTSATSGGGTAAPQNAKPPAEKQVQLQGTVSAVTGAADAFSFTVKGRSVSGTAATAFKGGTTRSFAGLVDGKSVHVAGIDKGTFVHATTITFQEEVPPAPPAVVISGTLSAITGDVPALTLTVGSSTVVTTGTTMVRNKNTALTLSALVVGQKVEVTGIADVDGIITATRVRITPAAPPPVVKFSGKGVVVDVAGSCPAATFTLQGKTVVTRAATKFTKVTCATLANGSTLQVTGTVSGDGSVSADTVKKIK